MKASFRSFAAEGCYFFLIKSNQKSRQQGGFFAARAFTLQSEQNHGLGKFALCCAPPVPALQQTFTMPFPPTTHHVLPAFTRSFPAAVLKIKADGAH
nr:hypothetical protein [uncultured Mucilaginibacter sp.]